MDKVIIGVDLGGTKIMTGVMNLRGEVLGEPIKVSTMGNDPAEVILTRIIDTITNAMEQLNISVQSVLGIGIGATGPLDITNGVILDCPQLPNMYNYPLRAKIQAHFAIPTYMNNDANCMIYGETVFGAAKGKKNVLGFTLGTGIGCAIVINGKIHNGSTGTAGEIWTSPYMGRTIEDFTCGQAVSDIYKALTKADKYGLEIHRLADQGDALALKTWQKYGEHLGVAMAWTINLLDPEIIVLGGSVSYAHTYFLPTTKSILSRYICREPYRQLKIEIAKLGAHAGFVGAGSIVLQHLKLNN